MSLISFRWLFLASMLWAGAVGAAAPSINTPGAAAGANGTATLSVNVTTGGKDTAVTFNYGLTVNYGTSKTQTVVGAVATQTVTVLLSGLVGGQTYHFQVIATNSDGSSPASAEQTFVESTYLPTLKLLAPTHASGVQTVHGTVTANGSTGNVFFQYGTTTAYGTNSTLMALAANDVDKAVNFDIPNPQLIYHYRLVFDDGGGGAVEAFTEDDLTNDAPTAVNDNVRITSSGPLAIAATANDTDPNNDALKITFVSAPKNGTATFTDTKITYTPGPNFRTTDTFTYTIDDGFMGIAKGTVFVKTLVSTLTGTHGGLVKKANGKEAGYFTLTTSTGGSFSGILLVKGKRYVLMGFLAPDGSYQGVASGSDGTLPVSFTTVSGEEGSTITATFGDGAYTATLSVDDKEGDSRMGLAGRYTVGLGSSGSALGDAGGIVDTNVTGPGVVADTGSEAITGGTGWLAIRARGDGTASIKGRLIDGRSFATRGTVDSINGVATLSFYDDPKDSRVIGALTLGDTVGGTVHLDQHSSGDGLYPRGFDVSQTVAGARYVPPENGKRVLDTETSKGQDLTIEFSGGALSNSFSRQLVLDDRDRIKVIDSNGEDLKLHIDRKSGRFEAKVTVDGEGRRIKASGVIIQGTNGGSGVGIFTNSKIPGSVTISAGGGSVTIPTVPLTPVIPVFPPDPTLVDPNSTSDVTVTQ